MKTENVKLDTGKNCHLFLDYDGTVYSGQSISIEDPGMMRAVQRLGHQLILNTGRSRGHPVAVWQGFEFERSRFIGENIRPGIVFLKEYRTIPVAQSAAVFSSDKPDFRRQELPFCQEILCRLAEKMQKVVRSRCKP